MSPAKSPTVQAAACRVRPLSDKKAEPVPAKNQKTKKPDADVCNDFVQSLNKPCTSSVQDDRFASLRATMAAFSSNFDKLACAPDARALPMKKENKLINPISYESPMDITYVTPQPPPKKRDEALYDYYLSDVKRRFPDWIKPVYNPATNQTGNCKWAVETLAAIMAWGAPESVYADVVEFCFGRNKNASAKNPAAAFLFKVKELKSQYRWKADWFEK